MTTTTETPSRSRRSSTPSSKKRGKEPEAKPIILVGDDLNKAIVRINSDSRLNPADRRAALDVLLFSFPIEPHPAGLYETETYVLPGGVLRAISVSGQTIAENTKTAGAEFFWPLIDVYEVPSMDRVRDSVLIAIERDMTPEVRGSWHRGVNVFRHVEILGQSFVHHDPTQPIDHLPRRACVMFTRAPLRLHVDTVEQAKKNGKGHVAFNPANFSGRFGC